MRKIKWGVLGTANIALGQVIPAMLMADNCELYGIAGRNKEKVDNFREMFGFKKGYYSLEEMLEDTEIEAVYIPLPNNMHKEWVIKAAEKGKHVLCEKPLAGEEADIQEMIVACDKAGVKFMEAFAYLHSPIIKAIKDAVDGGAIGKLGFIETTFLTSGYSSENIRVQRDTLGGGVYDLGCYNISLILTITGEEPSMVKAFARFTDEKIDDFAAAYMEFPSGCRASIVTGMCSPQRSDRFFIHGSKGTIAAPIPFNANGRLSYDIIEGDKTTTHYVETPNNYKLEVEQLGRCITDGETPNVSHDFSIKNARAIDKVLNDMGYRD
ncbi:MAG: Gfo/Idh/MocA family oxidoreductase [Clostridiaceae bacterium]|nr:Gfo/Idh/MocA family oxidoreductase [Clostridiaceae bacterium]